MGVTIKNGTLCFTDSGCCTLTIEGTATGFVFTAGQNTLEVRQPQLIQWTEIPSSTEVPTSTGAAPNGMFIIPAELDGWVVTKVGVATDETAPDSDLTVNFYLNGATLLGTPVMGSGEFHAEAVVSPPVSVASFDAITGMYEYTQGGSIPTGLNYLITLEWP